MSDSINEQRCPHGKTEPHTFCEHNRDSATCREWYACPDPSVVTPPAQDEPWVGKECDIAPLVGGVVILRSESSCYHSGGFSHSLTVAAALSVSTDDETLSDGPDLDMLEEAWGIIANATSCWTDTNAASPGWLEAAERWRDKYHARLAARRG